jgi:hypothetical protein
LPFAFVPLPALQPWYSNLLFGACEPIFVILVDRLD